MGDLTSPVLPLKSEPLKIFFAQREYWAESLKIANFYNQWSLLHFIGDKICEPKQDTKTVWCFCLKWVFNGAYTFSSKFIPKRIGHKVMALNQSIEIIHYDGNDVIAGVFVLKLPIRRVHYNSNSFW